MQGTGQRGDQARAKAPLAARPSSLRRLTLLALTLTAGTAAVVYTSLNASIAWTLAVAAVTLVGALAIASHRKLLATYHELRAWRRERQFDCWMRVASQLVEVRDHERAAYWYRRLVDEYPSSVEAWYGYASCLEDAQDYDRASRAYEQAHERSSGGDDGLLASAAKCALHADREERAVRLFTRLAERDPGFAKEVLNREPYRPLRDEQRVRRELEDEERGGTTPYA